MTVLGFSMLFLHSFKRPLGSRFDLCVCWMSYTTQDMRRTFSDTTWNYTLHAMNSLPKCRCVQNASLVWIDPLKINNSRKWPALVSNHHIFALWVVSYRSFHCINTQKKQLANSEYQKTLTFKMRLIPKPVILNEVYLSDRKLFMYLYFHNIRLFTVPYFSVRSLGSSTNP